MIQFRQAVFKLKMVIIGITSKDKVCHNFPFRVVILYLIFFSDWLVLYTYPKKIFNSIMTEMIPNFPPYCN